MMHLSGRPRRLMRQEAQAGVRVTTQQAVVAKRPPGEER